jgi:hypothetical protein
MADTVRIDPAAHAILSELARTEHRSLTETLSRAVEEYRRKAFLERLNSDFLTLKADAKAWATEQTEREAWETTGGDGLDE